MLDHDTTRKDTPQTKIYDGGKIFIMKNVLLNNCRA